MKKVKVAILGFGTVGQGVYRILTEKRSQLKQMLGVDLEVAKILVSNPNKPRPHAAKELLTNQIEEILDIPNLDVVFEAIVGEEPAYQYLDRLIEKGCNVITANKVMFSKHGKSLQEKAAKHGVQVGFEATVAGGVPVIKTMDNLLRVNEVQRIQGILNGTSNYILTQMRARGMAFEEALEDAQKLGYAEADPYNDISGQDAFRKLMILSELAFKEQPDWKDVKVQGINEITSQQVKEATEKGMRYRHIAVVQKNYKTGGVHATVRPELIDQSHPLYSIEEVNNAVTIEADLLGTVTLVGPGAGMLPTASAMVEDYGDMLTKTKNVISI